MSLATEEIVQNAIDKLSDNEKIQLAKKAKLLRKAKEANPLKFFIPTEPQAEFDNRIIPVSLFIGANAAGKTYIGAKKAICYCLGEDPSGTTDIKYPMPPNYGWVGVPDLTLGMESVYIAVQELLPAGAAKWEKEKHSWRFSNGSVLRMKSYESPVVKWQSAALEFIWFDEPPPEAIYNECVSRVNRRGGVIFFTLTPVNKDTTWIYTRLYSKRKTSKRIFIVESALQENFHNPDEVIEAQIESFRGTSEEAARLEGKFQLLQGRIHPNFCEEKHVIKPITLDKEFRFVRVTDFHEVAPISCSWFAFKEGKNSYAMKIAELARTGIRVKDYALEVRAMTDRMKLPNPIEFDILDVAESDSEKRNKQEFDITVRQEFSANGMPSIKPMRSFTNGRMRLDDYLEEDPPRFYVWNNCTITIEQFDTYVWDQYRGASKTEKNPKEKPKHKDDHFIRNIHYFFLQCMQPLSLFKEMTKKGQGAKARRELYNAYSTNYQS